MQLHGIDDLWPVPAGCQAVIFDFDGTLADSLGVWTEVDRIFFDRHGLPWDEGYAAAIHDLDFASCARYTIATYGLDRQVADVCAEWNAIGKDLYAEKVTLRHGAAEYLRALSSAGVKVALATTNDPDVVGAMMPRVDIDGLLPVRVHACEVAYPRKDRPDIFLEAARRLGVAPASCIVVEDLPVALRSARSAGMGCVGVVSGVDHQDLDALRAAADVVIPDWEWVFGRIVPAAR